MKLNLSTKFIILTVLSVIGAMVSHGTAIYAHAIEQSDAYIRITLGLAFFSILVSLLVPWVAIRNVFRPQAEMIEVMNRIAAGDTELPIPHTERTDEMGTMARALKIFKENVEKIAFLAQEQKRLQEYAQEQKRKATQELADRFETNIKHIVDIVASAAEQMDSTARSLASIAERNQTKLTTLANDIVGTTNSVQTIAGATRHLTSAIADINERAIRATTITNAAVSEAHKADGTVHSLTEAARKIGEVVAMINKIAGQINLLALNATIEAARAGDAGKGFAVVASEVKGLATQTTSATEQIAQYISSIQSATHDTVGVIKNIGGSIHEINEISTGIATAVKAQGDSTRNITHNVEQAASSTVQVSRNADEISASSEETQESAKQMRVATSELSRQSEVLRLEVDKFLTGIRNG